MGKVASQRLRGEWPSKDRSWFTIRSSAILAALILIGVLLGSASQFHVIILLCLIVLAGGSALHVIISPVGGDGHGRVPIRYPVYVAVPFGSAVVLISVCLLRAVGVYSVASGILALVVLICAVTYFYPQFFGRMVEKQLRFDVGLTAYTCSIILMLGIWSTWQFPGLSASAVYLTQGFDLFLPGHDPSEWPYFGEKAVMPMIYVTHAIGATFGLLSTGDRADFYLNGQYLLNILLAPFVPLGAYLVFARKLPWWAAAAAAAVFSAFVFDTRLTSLRGETLGWIFGLAFLLVLDDFFRAAERRRSAAMAIRLSIALAFLYFAMSLTHGISAIVTSFFALGIAAHWAATHRSSGHYLLLAKAAIVSFGLLTLLALLYVYSFTPDHSFSRVVHNSDQAPVAGEPDAALLFENAIDYPFAYPISEVRAAPPYASRLRIAETTALLPIAALPHYARTLTRLSWVALGDFPAKAYQKFAGISSGWKYYIALLVLCCGLYIFPFKTFNKKYAAVFWGSGCVYFSLIVFSIYLDSVSVSLFPLAVVRRTYPYVAFFFWFALFAAVLDFVVRPTTATLQILWNESCRTRAGLPSLYRFALSKYAAYAWGSFSVYSLMLWLSNHHRVRYDVVAGFAWLLGGLLFIEGSAGIRRSTLLARLKRSIQDKIGTYAVFAFGSLVGFLVIRGGLTQPSATALLLWVAIGVIVVQFSQTGLAFLRRAYPLITARLSALADLATVLLRQSLRNGLISRRRAVRICELATVVALVPFLLAWSTRTQDVGWAHSLAERLQERIYDRVASIAAGRRVGASDDPSVVAYQNLFDAMRFIRANTEPGEWVYSNIVSDNQFWFLSEGRYSVLEGSAMYQVYSLQKRAAMRLDAFYQVMQTSDARSLHPYNIRYLMLFKPNNCRYPACYGYNVISADKFIAAAKSPEFEKVYEDPEFVIYHLDWAASSQVSMQP